MNLDNHLACRSITNACNCAMSLTGRGFVLLAMDALLARVKALPPVKQRLANALIGCLVADAAGS